MEGLNFDNIMSGDEIENLFTGPEELETTDTTEKTTEDINGNTVDVEEEIETKDTTEVNPENLFSDKPESVGSGLEDSQDN